MYFTVILNNLLFTSRKNKALDIKINIGREKGGADN